jgi:uncharacterized SAM-binding protein YcdF (DUF218 family)
VFLILSKILDLLLAPLTWALLLVGWAWCCGAGRGWRWQLQVLGLLGLYVFSMPVVADMLQRQVEEGAVSTYQPEGCTTPSSSWAARWTRTRWSARAPRVQRGRPSGFSGGTRCCATGRARFVLLSGGTLDTRPGALVEANILEQQLKDWGVAPERILKEGNSRNTRENALESLRIVQERGWKRLLLVTSAAHMPRAQATFAAVGLRADTLVADVRAHAPVYRVNGWQPRARALSQGTDALRELVGRTIYRLRGWSTP